jgi:hypothetical protein
MGRGQDLLSRRKRRSPALSVLLGLLMIVTGVNSRALRAASTPPTPGDQVLIIYNSGDSYDTTLKNDIETALAAMASPPTVTELAVPSTASGATAGIQSYIAQPDKLGYLMQFCQVWDLRFNASHNSSAYSGTIQDDSITSGCPNCDAELFQQFLQQGGHLYLQGDHAEYYARNETLLSFLGTATGSAITYPGITPAVVYWTIFDNSAPDLFASNYGGTLTSMGSYYPGFIPAGGFGSGKALTKDGSGNALTILWDAPQLTAGNGKLVVMFDTNGLANDSGNITGTSQWQLYAQHLYTTLSTCYNFQATKTVDNPGPVCIGTTIHFVLCSQNTGTRALPVQSLWDTIPTCFSFVSSNPAPSTSAGNYYTWAAPSLSAGQSFCATVTVTVANGGPCP